MSGTKDSRWQEAWISVWNKGKASGITRNPRRETKQSHLIRPGTGARNKRRRWEDNRNCSAKQNKTTGEGLELVHRTQGVGQKTNQEYNKSSRSQAPIRKGLTLVICRPKNMSGNKNNNAAGQKTKRKGKVTNREVC